MKSKLGKWLFIWLLGMTAMVVLIALLFPGKHVDLKEINFKTSSSSRIYFKNMRSYFYDSEQDKASNYQLNRISTREIDDSNTFNFIIIDNWLLDEAYIMLETNLVDFPDSSIKIKYVESNEEKFIQLKEANNEANYIFAAQLYEVISRKNQLSIYQSNKWTPFSQEELKSLKKSLEDYFKLVGKIY
tara:strand:+ start:996 stop:1556 length:561 start_codon:yes stop_codon:yes gene_type:complete